MYCFRPPKLNQDEYRVPLVLYQALSHVYLKRQCCVCQAYELWREQRKSAAQSQLYMLLHNCLRGCIKLSSADSLIVLIFSRDLSNMSRPNPACLRVRYLPDQIVAFGHALVVRASGAVFQNHASNTIDVARKRLNVAIVLPLHTEVVNIRMTLPL
jgi:hypothetical protein